jgi:hypothetical protein
MRVAGVSRAGLCDDMNTWKLMGLDALGVVGTGGHCVARYAKRTCFTGRPDTSTRFNQAHRNVNLDPPMGPDQFFTESAAALDLDVALEAGGSSAS